MVGTSKASGAPHSSGARPLPGHLGPLLRKRLGSGLRGRAGETRAESAATDDSGHQALALNFNDPSQRCCNLNHKTGKETGTN